MMRIPGFTAEESIGAKRSTHASSARYSATLRHYRRRRLCVLLWRHYLVSRRRRLYERLEIPVCRSK